MKQERTKPIPEKKTRLVGELSNLIKNKKTALIASTKNLPDSQFQEIKKKLRGKALIKVPKKNIFIRAIDSSGKTLSEISEYLKEDFAILFSDLDCFDLASELAENKRPAKAKVGQEAPEDIKVQKGPTDLMPGPAVSELGALGIQISIEGGKISIKEQKIIVKKGEKISQKAADVMSKLNIKPFSVGFEPLAAFDSEEGKLYLEIKIDKQKTKEELKNAFVKALPFAVEIGYVSDDTIKLLITKAGRDWKAMSKKIAEAGASGDKEVINKENIEDKIEKSGNQNTQKNNEQLTDNKISEPTGEANVSEPKASENTQTSENKSEEEFK